MPETSVVVKIVGVVVAVVVVAVVILVSSSFASCEYYEYGFKKRASTGSVDTGFVYDTGRYLLGPDMTMKVFQADGHHIDMDGVAVFTSDRLEVKIKVTFLYFLRKDELPLLHKAYDIYYEPILRKNAVDALKVAATRFSTREFVRDRLKVESMLFKAVRERLGGRCCEQDCLESDGGCWEGCLPRGSCSETDKGLFASVQYFFMQDVTIPGDVEERFLRALLLQEETETEQFLQEAKVVEKETDKLVNEIENRAAEVKENATAQSKLIRERANANATATVETARSHGLQSLFSKLGLTTQEHKSSFDYLRSLREMDSVHLSVDFNNLIVGPRSP